MAARMYIWPRYALEVNGKRIVFPPILGAALSRLFVFSIRAPGHFMPTADLVDAAYFDDPEGGPLTAEACIRVMFFRVRKLLSRAGVTVDGLKGKYNGRFRLTLP